MGGSWNMVFVGTVEPPAGTWPTAPCTVIEKTPVIREKPYFFLDEGGSYFVMVPGLKTDGTQGITWATGTTPGAAMPLGSFHLAHPETDTAASINAALGQGRHLLVLVEGGRRRVAAPPAICGPLDGSALHGGDGAVLALPASCVLPPYLPNP